MKRPTIAALLGAVPMALDPVHGSGLMAMEMPSEMAAGASSSLGVPRGERYVITRGVAVVPVRGILTPNNDLCEKYLGWTTYYGLADTAGDLAASEEVQAIALDIDSPGGLVIGCEGAVMAIAALAAAKPVYAIASPLCASAAYWIGSQATSMAVTPGGIVGSIGARGDYCWPVGPDDDGEQEVIFTSSRARAKAPDPTSEKGQGLIQSNLDTIEQRFLEAVAVGRNIPMAELPQRLSMTDDPADGGGFYWPDDALARGLVDSVETCDAFYNRVLDAHAPAPRRTPARAYFAKAAAARAASAL